MEYRPLGATGLRVSVLAYGNWVTHGNQIQVDQAKACVRVALDAGITTFDTADVYAQGRAESVLGESLAGLDRASYELCTKVFFPMGLGQNQRGLSRKHVIEACEASLRRLGTDHIDLYQAHQFDAQTPLEETLEAFDHLVRQGKILYIGVSGWGLDHLKRAKDITTDSGLHHVVANQPQYSLLCRDIEKEIVPYCASAGISQLVWSPLAQGVLSGKYMPGGEAPAGSRAAETTGAAVEVMKKCWLHDDILVAVQKLIPVAGSAGFSLPQMALAWVLDNNNVAAAIIGASRPEQITENVGAVGKPLAPDLRAEIDAILGDIPGRELNN